LKNDFTIVDEWVEGREIIDELAEPVATAASITSYEGTQVETMAKYSASDTTRSTSSSTSESNAP
jgi:hypothetical protein